MFQTVQRYIDIPLSITDFPKEIGNGSQELEKHDGSYGG